MDPKILYVLDLKHVTKALTADNLLREVISDWEMDRKMVSVLIVHATSNQSEKSY